MDGNRGVTDWETVTITSAVSSLGRGVSARPIPRLPVNRRLPFRQGNQGHQFSGGPWYQTVTTVTICSCRENHWRSACKAAGPRQARSQR